MKIMIHAAHPAPLAEQLRAAHSDVTILTCSSYEALPGVLAEHRPDIVYSIRFDGTSGFPTCALLDKHGPRWIAVGGSGVDHLGHWDPDRTTVTNAAGVAAPMMAEYAFGCFLHFSLDIPELQKHKSERRWSPRTMSPLRNKTLLIVGLGHTGRAVARLAKSFGMHVVGTRARPRPMENVDDVRSADALHEVCGQADMIVVCTPLLDSTRNLFDGATFAAIKPGAVLVDVSRGGVVQSEALIQALRTGRLTGAALDVFDTEPLPEDSPYWDLPNTIISPHCSSVFADWDAASMAFFCENLTRWKVGKSLLNIVDPARGY